MFALAPLSELAKTTHAISRWMLTQRVLGIKFFIIANLTCSTRTLPFPFVLLKNSAAIHKPNLKQLPVQSLELEVAQTLTND